MVSYKVGFKSYNYHALEQKYGIYLQIYFISYSEIGKGVAKEKRRLQSETKMHTYMALSLCEL